MNKKIVLFLTLISLIVSSVVMYYLLFVPSSPHFLVLPHFMIDPVPVREQYEQLAQHTIDNIVLISPNHFDTCQGVFCTISQSHKVFRGNASVTMSPITDIVPAWKQLVKGETGRNKFITSDDLFYPNVQGKRITHEHGIGEHIRLIHRYFPDATVYPLVINPKRLVGIGQKELTMMINALRKQSHIAVIASVDFSHYISAEYARLHDQKTEYTMYHSTGLSEFMQCEVDCPTCLWLTVNVARGFDQYPHLEHRDFFSKSKIESTSRQLFSFGPLQQTKNGLTLIVGGDTIYTRGVRARYATSGALFAHFADFFQQRNTALPLATYRHRPLRGADLVGVNIESPLQYSPSSGSFSVTKEPCITKTKGNKIVFCSSAEIVSVLHDLGIMFATTANNHSLDKGMTGLVQTQNILQQGDIMPIGFQLVQTGKVRGIRYALHGVNLTIHTKNFADYLKQIHSFRQQGYINIVLVHRGTEYQTHHNRMQELLGQQLIDHGAEVIIGSGPHVMQDIGRYHGKPIIYSVGNFLFDQPYTGGIALITLGTDHILADIVEE